MKHMTDVFRGDLIGLILSGMGDDGLEGMREIKRCGGRTIVQDERSALIFAMPEAVIQAGCADCILPVDKIADTLIEWTGQ